MKLLTTNSNFSQSKHYNLLESSFHCKATVFEAICSNKPPRVKVQIQIFHM